MGLIINVPLACYAVFTVNTSKERLLEGFDNLQCVLFDEQITHHPVVYAIVIHVS